MPGPVDEAYVEIKPDFKSFASDTDRGITQGLKGIDPTVLELIDAMERQFTDLASQISSDFKDVGINIEQSLSAVDTSVERMGTTIVDSIGTSAESAERDAATMAQKFESSFRQISSDGEKTAAQVSEQGHSMGMAWSSALGFMASNAVTNAASKAFGFAKNAVFGFNAELQNSSIAFTTMLGSGQKAQSFLNQLQKFAASTPFEFSQLVTNAQQMLGMGIAAKDIIPDLTALGDAVAGVGGSADQINQVTLAFNQMSAKGKLDMGNMEQIMQGGVANALQILADGFHTTTGNMIDMISQGKVASSQALPMLVKGLENGTAHVKGLGGMMEQQSHTFTGALSNISDSANQVLGKVFLPLFNMASAGAQKLSSALSSPSLTSFGARVSATMTGAITGVRNFINTVSENTTVQHILGLVETAVKDVWTVITKDLIPAGRDIVSTYGPVVSQVFNPVLNAVQKLLGILSPLGGAVKDVFGFMADHKTTFQAIALAIAAMYTWSKLLAVQEMAVAAAARVAAIAQFLWDAAMDANPIGLIVIAIIGLVAAFAYLWTHSAAFRDFFIGVWNAIWGFLKMIGAWFAGPFTNFFVNLGTVLASPFVAVYNWIVGHWQLLLGILIGPFGAAVLLIIKYRDQIVTAISMAINSIRSALSAVGGFFSNAFSAAKSAAMGQINSLMSFVSGIPGKIRGALGSVGNLLSNVGHDIVSGMESGIRNSWHLVTDAVNGLINKIPSAVRSLLHIASPSKVMMKLGEYTAEGFGIGVKNKADDVQTAIQRAVRLPTLASSSSTSHNVAVAQGAIVININGNTTAAQAKTAGQAAADGFLSRLSGVGVLLNNGARA